MFLKQHFVLMWPCMFLAYFSEPAIARGWLDHLLKLSMLILVRTTLFSLIHFSRSKNQIF